MITHQPIFLLILLVPLAELAIAFMLKSNEDSIPHLLVEYPTGELSGGHQYSRISFSLDTSIL
jgi:hypothetical protein